MNQKIGWILEVDIRKYFDTLQHEWLRKILDRRVRDGVIRRLIGKWLAAGVWESGQLSYPEEGTPQGGVISPLLSNVYLHEVLDCWYGEEVKPRMKGRTFLVRFADDFILGFENQADAQKVYRVLFKRFGKYGLSLHPEKTRLVRFGRPEQASEGSSGGGLKPETFDFLGFTHYWGKSRAGRWVVRRKTMRKRLSRAIKGINRWCRQHRHEPLRIQVEQLGRKLKGHFGYYGLTGNYRSLQRFREGVLEVWRKWLARRGDRKGMSWERFHKLLDFFHLPEARVVHSISQ
jgi:group II intron reverse transcriptase/maturase